MFNNFKQDCFDIKVTASRMIRPTPTTLWLLLIASKRFVTVIHVQNTIQVPGGQRGS